jgi:hypothetical protein
LASLRELLRGRGLPRSYSEPAGVDVDAAMGLRALTVSMTNCGDRRAVVDTDTGSWCP